MKAPPLHDLPFLRIVERGPEGEVYAVAVDNLGLGRDVVADSVNPLEITRRAWRDVALHSGARWVEIEVVCSDAAEHRARVETRTVDVADLRPPTWDEVVNRHYEPWDSDRIVIDTAGQKMEESLAALQKALSAWRMAW